MSIFKKYLRSSIMLSLIFLFTMNTFAHSMSSSQSQFVQEILHNTNDINTQITQDHQKIIRLHTSYKNTHTLSSADKKWLDNLAKDYKAPSRNFNQSSTWRELEKRVDIIPPSLVLAQSIQESGWGRSYLARDAHNYFGQECGSSKSCYHSTDYRHFNNMHQAITAYIHNLNSNYAYLSLRNTRYSERNHHDQINSLSLANGLSHYSELHSRYIASIKKLIRDYHLQQYDKV